MDAKGSLRSVLYCSKQRNAKARAEERPSSEVRLPPLPCEAPLRLAGQPVTHRTLTGSVLFWMRPHIEKQLFRSGIRLQIEEHMHKNCPAFISKRTRGQDMECFEATCDIQNPRGASRTCNKHQNLCACLPRSAQTRKTGRNPAVGEVQLA